MSNSNWSGWDSNGKNTHKDGHYLDATNKNGTNADKDSNHIHMSEDGKKLYGWSSEEHNGKSPVSNRTHTYQRDITRNSINEAAGTDYKSRD